MVYCVKCGVQLAETERKCPLCSTVVYHPEMEWSPQQAAYPSGRMPKAQAGRKTLGGAIVILFLIPLIVSLSSDLQVHGRVDWFGYVVGALVVGYVPVALPLWFQKPNPVIFAPCSFAATALYLLYINLESGGGWFLSFAFPLVGGLCLITCAAITLLRYLKRGRLYIFGGASMLLGGWIYLTERLLTVTFGVRFVGWSVYPLIVLVLLGGLLVYLGINSSAREAFERKLFF